jgi:osmotically-inducible protein OsmY
LELANVDLTQRTPHERLLDAAKEAVSKVFGDTSVSQQTTIESLEDIADDINGMIAGIKEDIQAGRGDGEG